MKGQAMAVRVLVGPGNGEGLNLNNVSVRQQWSGSNQD